MALDVSHVLEAAPVLRPGPRSSRLGAIDGTWTPSKSWQKLVWLAVGAGDNFDAERAGMTAAMAGAAVDYRVISRRRGGDIVAG